MFCRKCGVMLREGAHFCRMCGTNSDRPAGSFGMPDRAGTSGMAGESAGKMNGRSSEPSKVADDWKSLESRRLNGHLEGNLRHTVHISREEEAAALKNRGNNRGSNPGLNSPPLADNKVEVVIRNGRQIFENVSGHTRQDSRPTGIYTDSRPTGMNVDAGPGNYYNDPKSNGYGNGVSNHAANTNIGYAPIPPLPPPPPSFKRNISNLVQGQVKRAISQVESVMGVRNPQNHINGNFAADMVDDKPFFTRVLDMPVDMKPVKRGGLWGLIVPLLIAFVIALFTFAYINTF